MPEKMGDFAAYMTQGGIRFQKKTDGKTRMVAREAVPPSVAAILEQRIKGERGRVEAPKEPKFPMPTEEEKRRLLEESLKVPEHLQMTPEEIEAGHSDRMTEADFNEPTEITTEPIPIDPEVVTKAMDADFLESVSIHSASLSDIAQALLERFGIYTVYLNALPIGDEYNPLTGEPFSKYHLGIAYQAAIRAQNQGVLNREPQRSVIDQARAASANFQEQFVPIPATMGEARRANSFDYRTSVRGMNEQTEGSVNGAASRMPRGDDEDEPILEPPLMGKPIIRPDW